MNKSISISLGASVLFACSSLAYGPTGHEIVGGIADNRLANDPPIPPPTEHRPNSSTPVQPSPATRQ